MGLTRRTILAAGAAAAATAALPRALAQQASKGGTGKFYEKGAVRIYYEEAGSGFPLLLIAGGGLNSTISGLANPFNPIPEFKAEYLCIAKFMVMGFCIGGPFIWNLLKRAPDRVVAAVLAQPSGSRPEARDLFYDTNIKGWGPDLVKRRPEITMETVDKFLTRMYRTNPDFVFTVTREFVRNCQTPVLILPDDIPA